MTGVQFSLLLAKINPAPKRSDFDCHLTVSLTQNRKLGPEIAECRVQTSERNNYMI